MNLLHCHPLACLHAGILQLSGSFPCWQDLRLRVGSPEIFTGTGATPAPFHPQHRFAELPHRFGRIVLKPPAMLSATNFGSHTCPHLSHLQSCTPNASVIAMSYCDTSFPDTSTYDLVSKFGSSLQVRPARHFGVGERGVPPRPDKRYREKAFLLLAFAHKVL